jgi:ssDNA-binding Zn-finger/Zn-ribbon topoisomerase 1
MKCPTCNTDMNINSGQFGKFYYCPEQKKCKQRTITCIDNSSNSAYFRTSVIQRHQTRPVSEEERASHFSTMSFEDYYGDEPNPY